MNNEQARRLLVQTVKPSDFSQPFGINCETKELQQKHHDITNHIKDKYVEYIARFNSDPAYVSLTTEAYESFCVEAYFAERRIFGMEPFVDRFYNADIVVNPYQYLPIVILGKGKNEFLGETIND